ncbi:hypothetical protein EAH86_19870 [Pedococcus bigeumensis]|uniref:Uncharacterized protein n=2 Tax=Pedococcus bigeumensis TaxID=433644 RepID=A0A502CFR6_9MICO|nr:hypothetical protein EAH86_19870 [Pedococcus bigeumensis]
MTAETRAVAQHQPWCNDHTPDSTGDRGACSWERALAAGHFVNVEEGEDGAPPYVAVWGDGNALTPQEARTMAADILEAADIAGANA